MDSRIQIDADICHGKPVIRGARLPVALILGSLASGMTCDEIQEDYELKREDMLAALCFAENGVEQDELYLSTR